MRALRREFAGLPIINHYASKAYNALLEKREEVDELKKKLIYDIKEWNGSIEYNIFSTDNWKLVGAIEFVTLIGELSATIFEIENGEE